MKTIRSLTMLAVAALAFSTALAATAMADKQRPSRHPDQVVLELSAEDWVDTKTARLMVAVDAAESARNAGGVRDQVLAVLGGLASGAEWHITRFDRGRDNAGLETSRVAAEARVGEDALSGIYDKARAASRPGLQVRITGIDFSPTLAENETVLADLRAQIYRQVGAELDRLKAAHPDRTFRMRTIDFVRTGPYPGQPRVAMEAATSRMNTLQAAPAPGGNFGVSRRMTLTATVVLAAE